MGAWFFKQPNGLYGRFSTVVDTVTDWNMNEKELYQYFVDHYGKYDESVVHFNRFLESYKSPMHNAFYLHEFDDVLNRIMSGNETTESVQELLIVMGVPEEEARKYYFMDYPVDAEDNDPIWNVYTSSLLKCQ